MKQAEKERKNHTPVVVVECTEDEDEDDAAAVVEHRVAVVSPEWVDTAAAAAVVAVGSIDKLEDSAVGFGSSKLPCHPLKLDFAVHCPKPRILIFSFRF